MEDMVGGLREREEMTASRGESGGVESMSRDKAGDDEG